MKEPRKKQNKDIENSLTTERLTQLLADGKMPRAVGLRNSSEPVNMDRVMSRFTENLVQMNVDATLIKSDMDNEEDG